MGENTKLFMRSVKEYWIFITQKEINIPVYDSGYSGEIHQLANFYDIPNQEISHWISCARLGVVRSYKQVELEKSYNSTICYRREGSRPGRRVLRCNKSIQ